LEVTSSKYNSIKSHLSKQAGVSVGVSERIDLPSNPGFDTYFLQEELMTGHHVVDHILVVRASFVVHRPSSVNELELTILGEVPDLALCIVVLFSPPHLEELHLNLSILAIRILQQLCNGRI